MRRAPSPGRRRLYFLGALVLVAAAAVAGPYSYIARAPIRRHSAAIDPTQPPRPVAPPGFTFNVTRHVIVISVDGLRPDAIARYAPATISRLAREGATSFSAQTIAPSLTLPSHTSMLTGTGPEVHGITWNTDLTIARGDDLPVPTVFAIARPFGMRTAAFFSKSKFHHLEHLESLDYSQSPDGGWGKILAYRTADDVRRHFEVERPNLTFVHLGDTDYTGHVMGWMSAPYGAAVRAADNAVRTILAAADQAFGRGRYVIILTADHGGNGRSHGDAGNPVNRTIPWIAWGQGVAGATALPDGIRTMDTAATALWLLGVPVPAHMVGRPVVAAFEPAP